MRAVIQRVKHASVTVDGNICGQIEEGLLLLVGFCEEDHEEDLEWTAKKISLLRVFNDENDVMNKSVIDVNGDILAVSQFTLYASYKKGNRPSYLGAAKPDISIPLYEKFCKKMTDSLGKEIQKGIFGADMKVELLNDGPVTICMDSKNKE